MPVHLRPSAPTAPDALLCGDPARALAIAQRILTNPRMSNHHRGLWGYYGETAAGRELTVQATGIGGPSAAIVIDELAELGLRRAIRVGTCTALGDAPAAGAAVVVGAALAGDGTSRALGAGGEAPVTPDAGLTGGLVRRLTGPPVTVLSRDLPPGRSGALRSDLGSTWKAEVADLQTAPLLLAAALRGIAAAAALAVGTSGGQRLEDEPLEACLLRIAAAAAEALGRVKGRESL